ncbi:MAG: lipid-binding SYLF domain-containing protein, partial [Shewanella sp.]|nr:lipid-binding SYLF domain-containing protein [Shewanella sp.]
MQSYSRTVFSIFFVLMSLITSTAFASDSYSQAVKGFSSAPETQRYLNSAYGYALFPTVGKAGFGVGGAYGEGKVFQAGVSKGDSTLTQLSIGFQIGGQAYSEIVFFKDKKAYDTFTRGNFEFNAQASAVAINLGANAQIGTTGNSARAGQSGGKQASAGEYINGLAVFTAAKGGLMFEAS